MTDAELLDLRTAHGNARDRILAALDRSWLASASRPAIAVALAELSAFIEGLGQAIRCVVCARALVDHDERQLHDCAVEQRARRTRAAAQFPRRQCSAQRYPGGPRCANDVATDKMSLCAGPHDFGAPTAEDIEAGKLGSNVRPFRKFALVAVPRRDDSPTAESGPEKPR